MEGGRNRSRDFPKTIHFSVIKMINHEEVKEELGLKVEFWNQNDVRWQLLWNYYLRAKASFQMNPNTAKLFETTETSVTMNVQIIPMQGIQPVK